MHSDFFEELFGRGFASPGGTQGRGGFRMRGEDHHARVLVDLEDSFNGATRPISLRMPGLTEDGHVTTRDRTLSVRIPRGIRPGQQIRLAGQGGPGLGGGGSGDLYLEVEFRDHPLYSVDGGDIYLHLPVAPWEAALGANVKVPTPSGNIDLKIPPNSRQGSKLRLKGRGLTGKQPGDMYVVLQVTLPPADSDAARALYKQMQEQLGFNPRAKMGVS
jgi:curved DNA-binding protein